MSNIIAARTIQVRGLYESRLTIRGGGDQNSVDSEGFHKIWCRAEAEAEEAEPRHHIEVEIGNNVNQLIKCIVHTDNSFLYFPLFNK